MQHQSFLLVRVKESHIPRCPFAGLVLLEHIRASTVWFDAQRNTGKRMFNIRLGKRDVLIETFLDSNAAGELQNVIGPMEVTTDELVIYVSKNSFINAH